MAISVKPFLDSTKIALEREASTRFGAAVEDFARDTFGASAQRALPSGQIPFNRNDGSFYATSYAAALAGATSYRPKLKFLFKVEFIFTPEAIAEFPGVLGGTSSNDFTFMVKSVDRPKIDFEYQDDVNMYNFRTKVLTKIRHRELTVTFMDDTGNRVLNFFRAIMMMQSPITRRQMQREGSTVIPDPTTYSSGSGMTFSRDATDNAMRGVVNNAFGNVIQTIRVKQMYVDPGEQLGSSVKEVIYDFMNSRIVSFDLDELSHETSDVSLMTMQFDYDWMEIVDVGSLTVMDGPQYNIATPGVGGAPVDMSTYGKQSLTNPGSGNGFGNIITNQLGRATQSITSSLINKAFQGKGTFASLIGSQASNIAGGLVGQATKDLAGGLVSSINQGAAGLFSGFVNDSAAGGPSKIIGLTSSSSDPLGAFLKKLL